MTKPIIDKTKLFVAIDTQIMNRALELVGGLKTTGCGFKVGLEFFNCFGANGVQKILQQATLNGQAPKIFLDLKLHDIPNTVEKGLGAILPLGPSMVNVHALGGQAMLKAARKAVDTVPLEKRPLLIAVTVLTSLNDDDMRDTGQGQNAAHQAYKLAQLAHDSGCDGVVCSALDVQDIKRLCGKNFVTVVPGIRPTWAVANDQKRAMTPSEACQKGADFLVVGRPITTAQQPLVAALKIMEEMENDPSFC